MFFRRALFSVFFNMSVYGLALFWTARTLDWWRAWVLIGVIGFGTVAMMLGVFRTRPELLRERMRGMVQRGQPTADRVLVLLFILSYVASIVFIARDVFRLHLLPRPSVWVSSLGLVLVCAGWAIVALVFRENDFAAPVVKHQAKRDHKVVDTGVYAIVRHPMYAAIFVMNVGMALWLESYAGALVAVVPIGVLAVRILFEEKFLRGALPGYPAYMEEVRYRLIPFVW